MKEPTIKKCPECFADIDSRATKCPHCKSNTKTGLRKHPLMYFLLAIFLFPIIFVSLNEPSSDSAIAEPVAKKQNTTAAYREMRDLVKAVLKSPASADFPLSPAVSNESDTGFTISSYVDAENSFVANIRSYFTADFYYPDGQTQTMKKLVFDGKTLYEARK